MITRYEITATHADGRAFLVAYTPRLSGTGLREAVHDRAPAIQRVTGIPADTRFQYHPKPRPHWTHDGWTIGFTGRTQLDAKREGVLPYIAADAVSA